MANDILRIKELWHEWKQGEISHYQQLEEAKSLVNPERDERDIQHKTKLYWFSHGICAGLSIALSNLDEWDYEENIPKVAVSNDISGD